ncbi:unnamed protein product [Candidula unifasciata]|uniref:Alanine racemase C-terminal domain-containing protein n=1 Tax=Candidula unifasciata TaxID=100452 RepID=A0A8S3ZLF3_9EUPU|nr:unnamed protein product [Candidula unifasciata]
MPPVSVKDVTNKSQEGINLTTKWQIIQVKPNLDEFSQAGRSTYLRVDLEAIWNNIQILKGKCSEKTEVIAVVKANAYGHGSVEVARYLNKCGLFHFAVATALEGKELRENGVTGYIQVLGNCVEEEINMMLKYNLTPTATNLQFIKKWAASIAQHYERVPSNGMLINVDTDWDKPKVVIKVDTGMSRNGCQCKELKSLMEACENNGIPVHSIMTHFAQAWDDPLSTQEQLKRFLEATKSYRCMGVKVHAANSAAIMQGYATDLDFVRPGIAMYGLAPEPTPEAAAMMQTMGLRPALAWIARPCLIKSLDAGRKVGYNQAYRLKQQERIATFSFGYADGYNRLLSGKGVLTDVSGKEYEIVGRVSMDAVTVRVDDSVTVQTPFYVIRDDYNSPNSASNIAQMLDTIPYEIGTSLSIRLPRIYHTKHKDN